MFTLKDLMPEVLRASIAAGAYTGLSGWAKAHKGAVAVACRYDRGDDQQWHLSLINGDGSTYWEKDGPSIQALLSEALVAVAHPAVQGQPKK